MAYSVFLQPAPIIHSRMSWSHLPAFSNNVDVGTNSVGFFFPYAVNNPYKVPPSQSPSLPPTSPAGRRSTE